MLSTKEPEIKVRLRKDGWEIEISSPESHLKQAIEDVLTTIGSQQTSQLSSQGSESQATVSKTCRGLILELWQESWFAGGRALSAVHDEIARRGYHYDRTAVAHALTDLVKENVLTREGVMRNYSYIQKKPPGEAKQSPGSPNVSAAA